MGGFLFAYLGRIVFNGWGTILSNQATQKMIFRTIFRLLRQLQRLPAEYHEKNSVGDLLHRLDFDVSLAGETTGTDHHRFASHCYYHCADFSDDGGLEPTLDSDCYTVSAGLFIASPSIPTSSPRLFRFGPISKGKDDCVSAGSDLLYGSRCNSSAGS